MTDEKAVSQEAFDNTPEIEPITAEEVNEVVAAAASSTSATTPVAETKKEEEVVETVIEKPSSVVLPNPTMTKIPSTVPTLSVVQPAENKLIKWWVGLFQKMSAPVMPQQADTTKPNPFASTPSAPSAKDEAKNRLQLVLMHDRTRLSPTLMESLRDELVEVISKYVEIDKSALNLSLEQEADTIALVANISVVRAHRDEEGTAAV